MSHYSVIARVSQELRRILWQSFDQQNDIKQYVKGLESIVFTNPTDANKNANHKLSLWLYQITENEFVKNRPMVRQDTNGNGNVALSFPPLAVNLFYLITPFASFNDSAESQTADHLLLGRTMQTLYDNAIVHLHSTIA